MKKSDFKSRDEMNAMNIADIKSHIRKFNEHYAIKGYSKMKKSELIDAVQKAQVRVLRKTKPKLNIPPKPPSPKAVTPKAPTPKAKTPKAPSPKAVTPKAKTPKAPSPKAVLPTSKELAKFGLTTEQANKLDPLELFSKLQPELKDIIQDQAIKKGGGNLFNLWLQVEGRMPKYLKRKEVVREIAKIQLKFLKDPKTGKGQRYAWGNTDFAGLLETLRERDDFPEQQRTAVFGALGDYFEKLLKDIQKEYDEALSKQDEKFSKRDPNKVNIGNVYNRVDTANLFDYYDVSNDLYDSIYGYGATFNMTEQQQEKAMERVSRITIRAVEKAIKAFLKGKKFKNADDAAEAFEEANKDDFNIFDFM